MANSATTIIRGVGRTFWFTASVFSIYCLPVVAILYSCVASRTYLEESVSVYIAQALADGYFKFVRDILGVIVVPLLTAYAASKPPSGDNDDILGTPERTAFASLLLALFVISMMLYAIIVIRKDSLDHYNSKVPIYETFTSTISTYAKEFLTYLALLLGIAAKK
jgi:hypothetical protein